MREKLIELLDNFWCPAVVDEDKCNRRCNVCMADYLIANGVLVLPCRLGDTVYQIINNTDACIDCRYYYGGFNEEWCEKNGFREYPTIAPFPLCEEQFMEVIEFVPSVEWIFQNRRDFGKTIFLTREEAEAALKEV